MNCARLPSRASSHRASGIVGNHQTFPNGGSCVVVVADGVEEAQQRILPPAATALGAGSIGNCCGEKCSYTSMTKRHR